MLRPDLMLLFFMLIPFFGTVLVGAVLHGDWNFSDIIQNNITIALSVRIIGLFSIFFFLCTAFVFVSDALKRLYQKKWWSRGNNPLAQAPDEWVDIFRSITFSGGDSDKDRYSDPISYVGTWKVFNLWHVVIIIFIYSIIGSSAALLFDYILFPRVPDIFLGDQAIEGNKLFGALANLSGNLTAYLALIAAAVSIVFTYTQLQAKVRASSRQKWINQIRVLMANILENMSSPSHKYGRKVIELDSISRNVINKNRILLELYLNPSEKDHRLLMFLIRAYVSGTNKVPVDIFLFKSIMAESNKSCKIRAQYASNMAMCSGCPEKYGIPGVAEAIECNSDDCPIKFMGGLYHVIKFRSFVPDKFEHNVDFDEIISSIFMLCQCIIRREWERVRHTK